MTGKGQVYFVNRLRKAQPVAKGGMNVEVPVDVSIDGFRVDDEAEVKDV